MSKLTRALAELAKRADAGDEVARKGIRAYHGSPHDFPPVRELEMPDGAVVYQSMDDAVPEGARVIKEHPLGRFDMSKIGTGEGAQAYGRGLYFAQAEGVGKGYRDQLSEGLGTVDGESIGGWAAEILDNSNGDPSALRARINMAPDDFWVMNFEEGIAAKDNLLGVVDRLESGVSTWRPGGHMYEVDIDANPDELLDWDKPLSEQSELVRKAVNDMGLSKAPNIKENPNFPDDFGMLPTDDPMGSELLSRSAQKNWAKMDQPGYGEAPFKAAGIKGIRYKDGFSRGSEGGSSNYVIFDDRLITISKKYGISIPAAAAVLAGTMTPEEAQAGSVSSALVDLAKRAVAGDTDAATEIAKYGGAGRILDQFGDPRSMDMSNLDQVPNVQQFGLERYNPPRGRPANLDPLLTDEAAQRMEGFARRGENRGGRAWYNTQPLRDEFISELGESEGAAAFDRYMDIVAATSPRSRVDANIRRSSYLYGEDRAGRPIAGLTNADFPPGYGHLAHLTQDASLKDLEGGRSFQSLDRPKTSSFAENLKGNQQPMTIDTHNFSAITGDNKNKKSPSGTQYKYLEDFQVEIANKLNMTPAQFQASVWMGAETGVADARPFLEVFDDVVARTAKRNDVSKQKALTDFIRGDAPLYGLAAVMTGGAIVPQEASASDIQANQGLVPFDKDIHTPRDVGFGGPSTEYTMTVDAPDGQVAVIPSIWWDTNGEPVVLDQRDAERRSFEYEQETGKQFPRFAPNDYASADEYAQARTRQGGASESPLASEYPSLGGMGVRMPPTAEDEEAMLAPTGGDLMQQANRDFVSSIRTQPEPDFLTSVQQQLLSGIMKTAGVADLSADVVSAMAGPLLSAPGAIARYAADRYVPGVNYSAEEMAQGRRETEDYFNYQPRTEQGPQYGEQIMQGIGGAIAPYVPAIKKAAGDSYILGAMRQGYDYLGEREKELAKALMDLSPI
jgi:hypothetical protein